MGLRTTALLISSNDEDENPFSVPLSASRATPCSDAWRQTYFGSPNNEGPGADLSDPDGDGIVNLIEYATGSNPLALTPPIGNLVKNGGTLEFTYRRPTAALTELSYRLEGSLTLSGTWSYIGMTTAILSDDGITQQVLVTTSAGSLGKRFVRLRVTRL